MKQLLTALLLVCLLAALLPNINAHLTLKQVSKLRDKEKLKFAQILLATALMPTDHKKQRIEQEDLQSDLQTAGLCATTMVNIRRGACTNSASIKVVPVGTRLTRIGGAKYACGLFPVFMVLIFFIPPPGYNWTKVTGAGVTGWIAKKYLGTCGNSKKSGNTKSNTTKKNGNKSGNKNGNKSGGKITTGDAKLRALGVAAAAFAQKQVGKCYSQDIKKRRGPVCFDCSGLVNVAWEKQGKRVPWTTHGYPSAGNMRRINKSQIRAGDILYRDGHVGMYVGHGSVVQASSPRVGVIRSPFSQFRYTAIYRPK